MVDFLPDLVDEFRRNKDLADRAMAQLSDDEFFRRPAGHVNPIATIVKHLAGNLRSRWSEFLTTDGEKPDRDRDREFVLTDADCRQSLLTAWERAWTTLFDTLAELSDADFVRTVTIRGEPHTFYQAIVRGLTHAAYHTGQILYVARLLRPDGVWLTIPPGQSAGFPGSYRQVANDAK